MARSAPPRRRWHRSAVLLTLAALGFVVLTGWLDGGAGVAPGRLLAQPLYPLANALPGLLLAGLLLALTRRVLLSFGLVLALQGLLVTVSRLKMQNLRMPLVPADFDMLGQLRGGGAHLLLGYLPRGFWPYLAALAALGMIVALWRREPPLLTPRPRLARLLAGGACALALVSLIAGLPLWGALYNGHRLWLEPWSASGTVEHSGLQSALVMYRLQDATRRPKPDPRAAAALIGETSPAVRERLQQAGVGERPDIVVVQSESFFDPAILRGYAGTDLTPNLHRLAAQGASGPLRVPTFGGGTIRTEFEVLTGLSLRYFDELKFPYLQMRAKVVPGLVRSLRAHGYETLAIHGNDPGFWNRSQAFRALGFDRFVAQSAFPADAPYDGKYMADRAMTDQILDELKDSGPPQFVFAISLEAHGPYDVEPADPAERDAIPVPPGVTGKARRELQNYLYHIRHADQELGRLAEALAARERPTLLLFYGDHLPGLTDSFRALGFVDGRDMLSEPGTWLLLDTHGGDRPAREELAAWMLPGRVLAAAGIHDEPYFALTQVLAPQLTPLTRAPEAPPVDALRDRTLDRAMASVARLRLDGKLDRLFAPQGLLAPPRPPRTVPFEDTPMRGVSQ